MRNSMKNLIASALVALVAILTSASPVKAGFVTINGGSSWGGWNTVGNSKTSGTWVLGSMGTGAADRTYNIYSTYFELTAGQPASGTGNDAASLFSGSWQAGDRIVGLGIQYTGKSLGQDFFFHRDAGAVNIKAATSYGAGDGMLSFDVGDTSSYINNSGLNIGLVRQYSVFTGYSANGGSNFITPWGTGGNDLQMPVRSFTVQDVSNTNKSKSVQFLMNIDAILRSNGGATYGEGSFESTMRLGFMETEAGGYSQQVFEVQAVPEPGASVVLFLGVASFVIRFRRR